MQQPSDKFRLFDLRVEVVGDAKEMVCSHAPGDYFEVRGEELHFPPGQQFSQYALAALLPHLPARQRHLDAADWMATDTEIACPDPHCGARFRITRIRERTFKHADVTRVPMNEEGRDG